LKIFLAHISEVVWRHSTTGIFNEALAHLRRVAMSCSACCNIILKQLAADETALFNLLLRCPHQTVRSQTRHFLIDCLKSFREAEPVLYGMESIDNSMELDTSASLEGVFAAIARRLRLIAYDSYQCTRSWDDLYLTLIKVVEMGHVETAVLLSNGFLVFCLQLFCTQSIPAFHLANPELARSMEKKKSIFNKLIQFTASLLSRIDIRLPMAMTDGQQTIDRMASLDREQMRFALTQQEHDIIFHWSTQLSAFTVLDKMLELFDDFRSERFYPGNVLKWMLGSSDPSIHDLGFTTIHQGITAADSSLCDAYARAAVHFCEVCPVMDNVERIVLRLAKAARALDQGDDTEISVSSEGLIQFFTRLPAVKNETLFQREHPGIFYQEWMTNSLLFAVPLLINGHEYIRGAAYDMLRGIFLDPAAEFTVGGLATKFNTIRRLIEELTERTVYEANLGTLRSHLEPMMAAGLFLTELLSRLVQSEDPELEEIHHENDIALIARWQSEVDNRARIWPDEGTPTSTVEGAFNNSDYGSESEEVELIDD
jgi:ubiquitin carboxyl-terminal hydrolase 34